MRSVVNHWFRIRNTAIFAAFLLPLTGCAGAATAEVSADATDPTPALENCGFRLDTTPSPQRVVTIKSTPLELMLALGLEDRVVASAFLDGPIPADLAPPGWEPNVISEDLPSQELLIAAAPDLLFAGWESNLSADGIGTRADLAKLAIRSYVAPPACEFGSDSAAALDFADIFTMFTEVGMLFGAEERAQTLIADQQNRLDAITPLTTSLSALWFSSGGDTPFVGGGTGAPNMIMSAAGLANVAEGEPQSWVSMPWETFIASDPDVIVLVDAPWNSAADKRKLLEEHPAARTMRAVQSGSYIIVDFATTEAGVRNIDAVEAIAHNAQEFANVR